MRRWLARAVAGFGIVVTLGCLFYGGSPGDPSWWSGGALYSIWALAPYSIAIVGSYLWTAPSAQVLIAIGAAAAMLPVPYLAYDLFFGPPDAQGGIVFLFLPVYQLFVVIAFSIAAWWAARVHARESRGSL